MPKREPSELAAYTRALDKLQDRRLKEDVRHYQRTQPLNEEITRLREAIRVLVTTGPAPSIRALEAQPVGQFFPRWVLKALRGDEDSACGLAALDVNNRIMALYDQANPDDPPTRVGNAVAVIYKQLVGQGIKESVALDLTRESMRLGLVEKATLADKISATLEGMKLEGMLDLAKKMQGGAASS